MAHEKFRFFVYIEHGANESKRTVQSDKDESMFEMNVFKYDVIEFSKAESKIEPTAPPERDTYIFGNQIKAMRLKINLKQGCK